MSKTLTKRKISIALILSISICFIGFYFIGNNNYDNPYITVNIRKGNFVIDVSATGELTAKNSIPISGPVELIRAGIFRVKIDHLVDEGTAVNAGDYVATLDRAPLLEKIGQVEADIQKLLAAYENVKLDTAFDLYMAREELFNLKLALQESELDLKQSIYEPLEAQRKVEIAKIKAERDYAKAIGSYELKKKKAINQTKEAWGFIHKARSLLAELNQLLDKFIITAPGNGLVIYTEDLSGNRVEASSMINGFQPVVASLPDLSKMISKIYVNELDISKVRLGQKVIIGLDAFPNKKLTGKVTFIDNIGENREYSNAKVFEVLVEIYEMDSLIRPGMTTSNTILIREYENVFTIPLECLHNVGDTLNFVYKWNDSRLIKQEVTAGEANNVEVIIEKGLSQQDKVLLSLPDGDFDFQYLRGR